MTEKTSAAANEAAQGNAGKDGKKVSIWSGAFISLIVINFFNSMGQMMMNTLIPLYAYGLGASAAMVGVVTSAFAITALACRPFVGPAFDSLSKKWMLFVAMVISVVAVFLYGRMTTVEGLVFARLLHGLSMSCSGPLAMALVSNSLPFERLGSGVSVYSLVGALCMAVGPALGLWMASVMSYTFVFTVSACVMTIGCVLVAFLKEPGEKVRKPYKISISRMFAKGAIIPASISCILGIAGSSVGSFIAIYAGLRGIENIGLYFTVNAIMLLATRPLYGHLADKYGFGKVIVPGLTMFALAFIIISHATTLPMFLVGACVNAFGNGAVMPLMQALSIQCVPLDQRGAASNTHFTGMDLGMLLGPSVGGLIVDSLENGGMAEVTSYSTLYMIAIIPMAIALLIYFLSRKKIEALKEAAKSSIAPAGEGAAEQAQA